jgi:drug/metabolite transporter (DMT)-like permease
MTSAHTGIVLISVSAIVWSTLGLFAKGIDADVWAILFWRGLFSSVFLGVYIYSKSDTGITHEFKELGWPGWLSAVIGAAATVCFISAFKYTAIANVSIIYATIPFIVSIFAWFFLRETINSISIICALCALLGVAIMVTGSTGSIHIIGDTLALLMAIGMSALVILFRKFPKHPMILSTLISALINILLSFMLNDPFAIGIEDLMMLILFGALFATATILTIEGTRMIPAFQSALIGTLEAPLAVLWAWMVFTQLPTTVTWLGGALVMVAVFWNMLGNSSQNRKNVENTQ